MSYFNAPPWQQLLPSEGGESYGGAAGAWDSMYPPYDTSTWDTMYPPWYDAQYGSYDDWLRQNRDYPFLPSGGLGGDRGSVWGPQQGNDLSFEIPPISIGGGGGGETPPTPSPTPAPTNGPSLTSNPPATTTTSPSETTTSTPPSTSLSYPDPSSSPSVSFIPSPTGSTSQSGGDFPSDEELGLAGLIFGGLSSLFGGGGGSSSSRSLHSVPITAITQEYMDPLVVQTEKSLADRPKLFSTHPYSNQTMPKSKRNPFTNNSFSTPLSDPFDSIYPYSG